MAGFKQLQIVFICIIIVTVVVGRLRKATEDNGGVCVIGETKCESCPYHAAILWNHILLCSGSIIAETWVLTAEHCL